MHFEVYSHWQVQRIHPQNSLTVEGAPKLEPGRELSSTFSLNGQGSSVSDRQIFTRPSLFRPSRVYVCVISARESRTHNSPKWRRGVTRPEPNNVTQTGPRRMEIVRNNNEVVFYFAVFWASLKLPLRRRFTYPSGRGLPLRLRFTPPAAVYPSGCGLPLRGAVYPSGCGLPLRGRFTPPAAVNPSGRLKKDCRRKPP